MDDLAIVNKANELYEAGEWQKIYDLLFPHRHTLNPEILWRLARAARDVSLLPDTTEENKKKLAYECLEYAKKAIEHGPDNYACQKWCGVALANVGDYEGMKAKIMNAFVIRNHFERAVEINPKDSTSLHLLGRWCFTFADMPWYQHKVAAALFATPPKSTFEEALEYFERAETNEPGFYCDNQLMLGKTHLKLGHREEAKQWLIKTIESIAKRPEDKKSQDEARKHLKTL
jgi:tetratricopeptide (TPR) repeat protein